MFGTVNGYGIDVARQRIEELHRDAERYRLAKRARRRRVRRRRVLRGWLRPAPARSAAAR
jgi:hypothetical protein